MSEKQAKRTRQRSDSRVTTITRKKRRSDDLSQTREITEDSFLVGSGLSEVCIPAPYDIESLCSIFERSNILRQCVDALTINTCSYGYRIVATDPDVEIDPKEKSLLRSFIESANPDESLETISGAVIDDQERIGFGFLEIFRNKANKFSHARYIKARYIRATTKGKPISITRKMMRGDVEVDVSTRRAFRRYVQTINGNKVYFKEFGDPRRMSYITGRYEGEMVNGVRLRVRKAHEATELLHFKNKSDDVYGVPKWVHQMPSILGSRESEECNFRYFQDNMIPAAILSVAGGKLSAQSYRDVVNILNGGDAGEDRQNKIVLIEAVPEVDGLDDGGTVTVKLEKLTDSRPEDGLFGDYDKANMDKVRGTWRLPSTAVGASQDTTFATANVSQAVAESQVYLPARRQKDNLLNKSLVNGEYGLNLKTCRLESLAPAITNPESVVKAMTALGVLGAISPRDAVKLANQELRIPVEQYPEKGEEGYEEWMDKPTHIIMKLMKEAVESDDSANGKDSETKAIEKEGDLDRQPEHGSE